MIDKNIERGVYDPAILDYYDDEELEEWIPYSSAHVTKTLPTQVCDR